MDDPQTWAIIWLVAAVAFGSAEMAVAGSFFLVPFAVGAAIASVASLIGAPILIGWLLFVLGSVGSFIALKPLARRLDAQLPRPEGFGANRLLGSIGLVEETIPAGRSGAGLVKVGSEQWRADGRDGMGIQAGSPVRVLEVRGTRIIVEPTDQSGLGQFSWSEPPLTP